MSLGRRRTWNPPWTKKRNGDAWPMVGSPKRVAAGVPPVKSHVPGWWLTCFIFHFIYGMSSFPLTNSIIFQRGRHTANQCTYEAFLKWGIPKTMGFNTKSCSNDLDDLGVPPWLRKPPYEIPWCKRLHRCGLHMVFRSNDRQAAREVSGPHGWSLWDGYLTLVHPHFNPYPWSFMKLAFLPYRMIFVLSSLHKSHKSLMTCVFQKNTSANLLLRKKWPPWIRIQRCTIPKIPWSLKIIQLWPFISYNWL